MPLQGMQMTTSQLLMVEADCDDIICDPVPVHYIHHMYNTHMQINNSDESDPKQAKFSNLDKIEHPRTSTPRIDKHCCRTHFL